MNDLAKLPPIERDQEYRDPEHVSLRAFTFWIFDPPAEVAGDTRRLVATGTRARRRPRRRPGT